MYKSQPSQSRTDNQDNGSVARSLPGGAVEYQGHGVKVKVIRALTKYTYAGGLPST